MTNYYRNIISFSLTRRNNSSQSS